MSQTIDRKTFAIVSHPDAGKTTITEKLLLFGGAIQMAGTVKAKKSKKFATSDWMEIEKQRGISVTSSVMKFHYKNTDINLLDTPGHDDFSEDTYRVLTAVDSVLMIIDGVKGVEAQTIKLLQVCKSRNMPIMTFVNKFDRDTREPLDLIDEIEKTLGIRCAPITWPVGSGKNFKGVYDIEQNGMRVFAPGTHDDSDSLMKMDVTSPDLEKLIGTVFFEELRDSLELLNEAGTQFDHDEFMAGSVTPVFFGSALNNFGVREFLHKFLACAPSPLPKTAKERIVDPVEEKMTGFVFKIQANMDPNHRDRIAFMRICSGRYYNSMKLYHCRLDKEIRSSNSVVFMAKERENTDEAFAGDIIGLRDTGLLKIADTLTEGEVLNFTGIPSFSPEIFCRIRLANPLKNKQLDKGLVQLTEEGTAQLFYLKTGTLPIVGAVGALQFEVMKFRLLNEYGVEGIFESVPFRLARWYGSENQTELDGFETKYVDRIATDKTEQTVFLATSDWELEFAMKKFPAVKFYSNSDLV